MVFLAAHKTIAGILGLGGITGSFGTPTTFPNGSGDGGVTSFLEPQQKSRTFGSFLTQANEEILNASLKLAEKALKKPGCKTLIAGAVSNDPAKLLAKLKASNQLREGNLMKLIGRQAGGVTDGYGEDAYITF
ncbi:MAG: hypothetical protein IPL01_13565 [Acidobacteria bacterium]|nr:hypothetical protein [Acidobacteriota bacterium]